MRHFIFREVGGKVFHLAMPGHITIDQKRQAMAKATEALLSADIERAFWVELRAESQQMGRTFSQTLELLGQPSTPILRELLSEESKPLEMMP